MNKRQAEQPIRVLIVDDSEAQRALLVGLLEASDEFVVVGTASTGHEAIAAALHLRPSVIAMDIYLPGLDGYEATRRIMQCCPTPIVMVSSSDVAARRTAEALAVGALAVVRKPKGLLAEDGASDRATFLTTLRLMADVAVVRHQRKSEPVLPAQAAVVGAEPQVLAIAASTGGPAAVQQLLTGLGGAFALPILLVQHIASGFAQGLVDWLNTVVPLPAQIARHGERMLPGHVYLAPADQHLLVWSRGLTALRPNAAGDRYCPSADLLFESVAAAYAGRAIGVVLTGMGDDGTRGLLALRAAGSHTLAQDEASCVVYGMPKAAVEAGAAARVVPLSDLALAIQEHMMANAGRTQGR